MSMEDFEKQLEAINMDVPKPEEPKKMTVQKNTILSFPSDFSGCGTVRNLQIMSYINSISKETGIFGLPTHIFSTQTEVLASARAIMFQRQMTPQHLEVVKMYKQNQPQFQYRMVWDMDDLIWGYNEEQGGTKEDGVPSYNFGSTNIGKEIKETSVEIMKHMDVLTFSTKWLADYARDVLGMTNRIEVVPNCVPQYLWGNDRRADIKVRPAKPRVIYTGSPSHYSNQKKMYGDFDNNWREWVIKSVKEGKIEFTCFGGLPWFFEEIQDKIKVINFLNYYRYPAAVKSQRADIGIMPLIPNNFNSGKSDIKAIEHYAAGIPCIGSVFGKDRVSPYDTNPVTIDWNASVKEIDEKINWMLEPNNFNRIKNQQYNKLHDEGRYLESKKFIDTFFKPLLS